MMRRILFRVIYKYFEPNKIYMRKETENWVKKAKEDVGTASYNLKGKRLKAMQIEKLGRFDGVHDLLALAKSVEAPENII